MASSSSLLFKDIVTPVDAAEVPVESMESMEDSKEASLADASEVLMTEATVLPQGKIVARRGAHVQVLPRKTTDMHISCAACSCVFAAPPSRLLVVCPQCNKITRKCKSCHKEYATTINKAYRDTKKCFRCKPSARRPSAEGGATSEAKPTKKTPLLYTSCEGCGVQVKHDASSIVNTCRDCSITLLKLAMTCDSSADRKTIRACRGCQCAFFANEYKIATQHTTGYVLCPDCETNVDSMIF